MSEEEATLSEQLEMSDAALEEALFGSPTGDDVFSSDDATTEGEVSEEEVFSKPNEAPQPKMTQAQAEKILLKLKLDGREEERELTRDELAAKVQMAENYDRKMSQLDIDRQALEQRLATSGQLEAEGSVLKDIRENHPGLYAKLFNTIEEHRSGAGKPAQESEVQKLVQEFDEMANSQELRDLPFAAKSNAVFKALTNHIQSMEKNGMALIQQQQAKIAQLEQFKDTYQQTEVQQQNLQLANQFKALAEKNDIKFTANDDEVIAIQSMMNGGFPLEKAFGIAYRDRISANKSPEQEVSKKETTTTRERRPVKSAIRKGKNFKLSEDEAKLEEHLFGQIKSDVDFM